MTTGLPTGYKQFSLVVPKPSSRVKKGKNLFDIAFSFKNFGVGARFTRAGWQYPEPCYWTVTSVKPRKNEPDMKRGKAWGVLTWRGVTDATPRRIRTTTKKDWSYIKEGEEVPTYSLDEETHSRRYNYFEGGVAEPEPHVTEGAEHVFRATRRGVTEDIKPRLAPWKVENFTDEEIDKMIANVGKRSKSQATEGENKEKSDLS